MITLFLLLLTAHPIATPQFADPLDELRAWLSVDRSRRPELSKEKFAETALTGEQAKQAAELLWRDHFAFVQQTREAEWRDKRIKIDGLEMKFDYRVFGEKPPKGRSLYLSLHGGGSAPKRVNDQQWQNQQRLYRPEEGVYLAPRAPNDAWNMWFQPHMDSFFERLILDAVVFEGVNPDRVYLTGYSAGGDGVYRLAPRLADRWAAAAMMAGHPGEATPLNLRNLPFTLHMGEKDAAFERNKRAAEWKKRLAELRQHDPDGYVHEVIIHPGKGHWMDRQDARAIPWMARHTRNTVPSKVIWQSAGDKNKKSFYWLAIPGDLPEQFNITATCEKQTIRLQAEGTEDVTCLFRDDLLDLDLPVNVMIGNQVVFTGKPVRTINTIHMTLQERKDPGLTYYARVDVRLANSK